MFPLHVVLLAFSLLRRQSTLRWCYAAVTCMPRSDRSSHGLKPEHRWLGHGTSRTRQGLLGQRKRARVCLCVCVCVWICFMSFRGWATLPLNVYSPLTLAVVEVMNGWCEEGCLEIARVCFSPLAGHISFAGTPVPANESGHRQAFQWSCSVELNPSSRSV